MAVRPIPVFNSYEALSARESESAWPSLQTSPDRQIQTGHHYSGSTTDTPDSQADTLDDFRGYEATTTAGSFRREGKGKGKLIKTTASCECDGGNCVSDLRCTTQNSVVPTVKATSGAKLPHLLSNQTGHLPDGPAITAKPGQQCTPVHSESIIKVAAVQEGIPCTAQRPWQEPRLTEPQRLRKKQMNKQQAAATELRWEVASELGSELGDDTPSAEIWPIREKPKQESLASLLANFTMPAVPLLQSLFEDFASELKKYKEYWTKKREQYKLYWIKIQEKCKR